MRHRASMALGCLVAAASVIAVHGQAGRPQNGPVRGATTVGSGSSGTIHIYPQLMHVRFTKAVTAPAAEGTDQDIRAHLESPLLATVDGSSTKAVVLPSDIDVNLSVQITSADAQKTNARMQVRIMSANVDPAEGRRRFFSAEVTHQFAGWPKPGEVVIPAGATLSIPYFGSDTAVGRNTLQATDPNANRADDSYGSRPILAGVDLYMSLDDVPIDVNNAGSNKLFRAQLMKDMEYPTSGGPMPAGAINLVKGTTVYLRSYEPDPSAPFGHIAVWSVAFVVIDGRKIPVRGVEIRQPFAPGSMAISPDGKRKIPMVLWPLGQTRQFQVAEQQEVSSNGTPLWTYPTTAEIASASDTPAPASPTAATSPEIPRTGTPAAVPRLPPDLQQRLDDAQRRAEDQRACQQKAVKDHQGDPQGLAQALNACRQPAPTQR